MSCWQKLIAFWSDWKHFIVPTNRRTLNLVGTVKVSLESIRCKIQSWMYYRNTTCDTYGFSQNWKFCSEESIPFISYWVSWFLNSMDCTQKVNSIRIIIVSSYRIFIPILLHIVGWHYDTCLDIIINYFSLTSGFFSNSLLYLWRKTHYIFYFYS